MDADFWVAALTLLLLYAAVLYRQVRGRADQVPFLFLGAAVLLVLAGVLSPGAAGAAVNLPVLVFLFSMFVFAVALDRAGVLAHLAWWLASKARRPEDLVPLLFVGLGLFSSVVVNDAVVVLMVPLLLHLARRLRVAPTPLLLTLAFSVSVGSALTPLGNPQNLLIAFASGMPAPLVTFLRYLLLPVLLSLLAGGWMLRRWFAPLLRPGPAGEEELRLPPVRLFPRGGWWRRLRLYPSLVVFPATLAAAFAADAAGALGRAPPVPVYLIVAAGAALLLLVQPAREGVLARVDWSTLLLFLGLFVVMGAEVHAGVVGVMARALPVAPPAAGGLGAAGIGSILLSSAVGSQVFSNVPWVALSIPTMQGLGFGPGNPVAWVALAAGSTLAGNLTMLGAASNLIIANQAERGGVRIRLGMFVRFGAPLAALTLGITGVALALRL